MTRTTVFEDDLYEDRKPLHRAILGKVFRRGTGAEARFRLPGTLTFDYVVEVDGEARRIEYKADKRMRGTGNFVFETVPYVLDEHFPPDIDALGARIRAGTEVHGSVIAFVDHVNGVRPPWAKPSRHMSVEEAGLFSYLAMERDGYGLSDVWRLFLFDMAELSRFVRSAYRTSDVFVTHTKKGSRDTWWHTMGCLVPASSVAIPFLCYDSEGNPVPIGG